MTQAELISKETTNANYDFWWFIKPSGIYEFITTAFTWIYDVLASSWRVIVSAWPSGDKSSFSEIQPPPKNQPLQESQPLGSQSSLPANNGSKDQENTAGEVLKHVKSTLTQLKSVFNETRSDDSSEILFAKQPKYFSFQIFQLISLVYWWADDVLISSTVNKKSFNEPSREHQPSLPAKERNDESENFLTNADVSKREARSMLTQINAKSSVSEETTKDPKSHSHMLSWLSQSHRLQSMIDLWLNDVAASNITNNKISQCPLESQPPLPAKESDNKLIKDRKRISQFFRIHELTEMLKRWFNDTFPPNTIVKNKQVVFQPSLENQSPLPAKKNDDSLKDREKITADDVLENVRSIASQFMKEKSKRTITSADNITSILFIRRLEHDNIQLFKLVSIVYWWVTLVLNTGKKSSNEPPLESQFSLPAKENDGPKDQEINIFDDILKREYRSLLTELKAKSKVSEEITVKTMLEHRAINATAYIERLPEEGIDPDFVDNLNDLTSFMLNSKNFQKLKIESDVHNVTYISAEFNHSIVSPIAASSNNYQIIENNSITHMPDMFEYPTSVHNYTAPPTVAYIASNTMYVHPKSNSTLTHVLGESFDHFTKSSIAMSPDNYHQTKKNTPETYNVSNDKAGNDDPSIHKTVNFHRNEGDKTFKLKDNVKPSNKVQIYSNYSRIRYYSQYRISLL